MTFQGVLGFEVPSAGVRRHADRSSAALAASCQRGELHINDRSNSQAQAGRQVAARMPYDHIRGVDRDRGTDESSMTAQSRAFLALNFFFLEGHHPRGDGARRFEGRATNGAW